MLNTLATLSFAFKLGRAGLPRITASACASPWLALAKTFSPKLRPTIAVPPYWKSLRTRQITSMGRKRKAADPEESAEGAQGSEESTSGSSQAEEARPTSTEAGPSSDTSLQVNPKRYRELKAGDIKKGPVIYWYIGCKQHSSFVTSQAYQPKWLALCQLPCSTTFLALASSKSAHSLSSVCTYRCLQDVKRSACEGQLGLAVCMRGGRAYQLKCCSCLQFGAQQHDCFVL